MSTPETDRRYLLGHEVDGRPSKKARRALMKAARDRHHPGSDRAKDELRSMMSAKSFAKVLAK